MSAQQKKLAGIWLDSTKAVIITQNEKEPGSFHILNTLKAKENLRGGSEHTMNNAKQAGDLKYFKEIAAELLPYDEILIFGPGQTQEQLQHHLDGQSTFNNKKITVDSAGQLTDNQGTAKVRDFFKTGL